MTEADDRLLGLCEFIGDRLDHEKDARADMVFPDGYSAGFSDGAIEALEYVFREVRRRMKKEAGR